MMYFPMQETAERHAAKHSTRTGTNYYVIARQLPGSAALVEYASTPRPDWAPEGFKTLKTYEPDWKRVPFGSLPYYCARMFDTEGERNAAILRLREQRPGLVVKSFKRCARAGGAAVNVYMLVARERMPRSAEHFREQMAR